jgi:mannose-6-phosphate isomerase-like protein (cupin superfamily)
MEEPVSDTTETELRGAEKKEAFHQAAEAGVKTFKFDLSEVDVPMTKKLHVKLAGTNSTRASVQVLHPGDGNNLHYHPNMDLIYMVLKGRMRFYGPGEKILGEFGVNEGLLLPENSRYWFESIGEEEAWLLQIAGYPKGAKAVKRINVDPPKKTLGGSWIGMTPEEQADMDRIVFDGGPGERRA